MQRSLFLTVPVMAVILLTGCGSLHPKNEPIIEDYISSDWPERATKLNSRKTSPTTVALSGIPYPTRTFRT